MRRANDENQPEDSCVEMTLMVRDYRIHTLMRRGFFGDENVGTFVFFFGGEDLLFVVTALGVELPRVELGAGQSCVLAG